MNTNIGDYARRVRNCPFLSRYWQSLLFEAGRENTENRDHILAAIDNYEVVLARTGEELQNEMTDTLLRWKREDRYSAESSDGENAPHIPPINQ